MARFFINRPIVAMVLSILMVIVGLVAMSGLPTAQFPNIVPPEIKVSTTYTGADALTLEQSVATPIEQEMSGVDNMNYMYSINANNGETKLTVNFDIKTDTNTDQLLVQMRKGQAESQLPSDVRNYGVTVQKSTSSPLIMFALYSPNGTYDNVFLANYCYINIIDQMTRIPGIASVTIFGAGNYAMRLWVKPDRLARLNITIPEIVDAINTQNTVNPAGQVGAEPVPPGQEFTYTVRAPGKLTSPEAFGPTRVQPGYFMVRREPMLPSIHSMWPSASTRARLVTRLKTLFDQFWIVVYVTRADGLTTISTTAECSESEVYTGAEHPSM